MSDNGVSRQTPDSSQARRAFGAAATTYDAAAALQDAVRERLLARLGSITHRPVRILDLGCGTGRGCEALCLHYGEAEVIGFDFAEPMARATARRGQRWPCIRALAGDAAHLPLAADSFDLVFSSLALQWCPDLDRVLDECRRVLRPGGALLFATLGPDTLKELRTAWAQVDDFPHVHEFLQEDRVEQAMAQAGLAEVSLEREDVVMTYPDLRGLTDDLRGLGAVNAAAGRARGLTGKGRIRRLHAAYEAFRDAGGNLPATYEVLYGRARTSGDAVDLTRGAAAAGATLSALEGRP